MSIGPRNIPLVTVRLLRLPVDVQARASQHADELIREFQLIAAQLHDEPSAVTHTPIRLIRLIDTLTNEYSTFTGEPEQQIERAIAEGDLVIDELVYRVPAAVAGAAHELGVMLDECDEFCRSGELLTLATPPELLRYRRWYLGEFGRQVAGEPPIAWPDFGD